MVKLQDPTVAYSAVVSRRRQARAEEHGERFRLGVHGLDCGADTRVPGPSAVIGASAWALKSEQVDQTVRTIGLVGGLLADAGFRVCPIGADRARESGPALVVWVCGDETEADEFDQLEAIGSPGLSIGSCVNGLDNWSYIETEELADRYDFIRLFVDEVAWLLDRFSPEVSAGLGAWPVVRGTSTVTSTVPPDTDESGPGPASTTAEQNRSSAPQSDTGRDGPSRGSNRS